MGVLKGWMGKIFSNEPDAKVLSRLRTEEYALLLLAAAIASVTLLLWFFPALDGLAPADWSKMTANTAIGILLSAGSMALTRRQLSWQRRLGMGLAGLVLLLGVLTLIEYAAHISFRLETLLPNNAHTPYPGRCSPQTASGFTLLGFCMLSIGQAKNVWSRFSDIAAIGLHALNFIMLGGYFFGALDLLGIGKSITMSPQTLVAFFCFGTAAVLRRAQQSDLLAVLINIGIGSRMVRVLLPVSVFVPFALLSAEAYLFKSGLTTEPYAQAIVAASAAVLTLCLVTWMGWRINALERELRDLSLTDELTKVYNRRGFYFLGQQAIREAQRASTGLSLFFFDLDGLKHVNDLLGHETGSAMIKAFADILAATFRKSDIIGRVGGDEFAVITIRDDAMWIKSVQARLESLTAAHNADSGETYRLSFSTGYAELALEYADTLDTLVTRADSLMYKDKAQRKLAA
jgi:diguanylate cyclase (GGDEF)-like protein